ncbi:hypothetical protein [Mesorhizobium sp. B2-4-6]|uniref:hypothetical protein n=1 Tax=Mesorhizobium sp. B2-4-6 TaxID=2589943 RepID=UPI00112B0F45|nr:hypothetical protein [Mesorhizobium sp. B2-4-6]TPL38881.1 hypothetical protein FJ957_28015 [Mesorhizobium sp. B2-4-6]
MWQNDILVLPDDLIAFAWSAPMRELATKLDLSDVGLKKLLTRCGVVSPPQGYWNKVRAGKRVPALPKAPPRRAGELGRVSVDARFARVLPVAAPLPSTGPFASTAVPEDLDKLHAQELQAIGKVSVPQTLDRPHKGLVQMLKREQRRRDKNAEREWTWDEPKFDTPLGKRRLRILNALFLALSKRGHDGDAYDHDGEIHARAIIGDTLLGLDLQIIGSHRTVRQQGYLRPAPDLPASTLLTLRVNSGFDRKDTVSWEDDGETRLESKIAEIAAAIIVVGEKKFRLSLREAEERAERELVEKEKKRQERLAQLNQQRLQNLRTSGELLRQAHDIRALVENVRRAIDEGSVDIDASSVEAWQQWALAEADRIDPVRSGQILTHLNEPSL